MLLLVIVLEKGHQTSTRVEETSMRNQRSRQIKDNKIKRTTRKEACVACKVEEHTDAVLPGTKLHQHCLARVYACGVQPCLPRPVTYIPQSTHTDCSSGFADISFKYRYSVGRFEVSLVVVWGNSKGQTFVFPIFLFPFLTGRGWSTKARSKSRPFFNLLPPSSFVSLQPIHPQST